MKTPEIDKNLIVNKVKLGFWVFMEISTTLSIDQTKRSIILIGFPRLLIFLNASKIEVVLFLTTPCIFTDMYEYVYTVSPFGRRRHYKIHMDRSVYIYSLSHIGWVKNFSDKRGSRRTNEVVRGRNMYDPSDSEKERDRGKEEKTRWSRGSQW